MTIAYDTPEDLRELNKTVAKRLSSVSLVFVEVEVDGRIQIHSHSFDKNTPWFIVPNYSTETDSALRLIRDLPEGYEFVLLRRREYWKAGIRCRYNAAKDKFDKASTPALAICKAWLPWMNEQIVSGEKVSQP